MKRAHYFTAMDVFTATEHFFFHLFILFVLFVFILSLCCAKFAFVYVYGFFLLLSPILLFIYYMAAHVIEFSFFSHALNFQ